MTLSDNDKRLVGEWLTSQEDKVGFKLYTRMLEIECEDIKKEVMTKRGQVCDYERGRHESIQWVLDTSDRMTRKIIRPTED